MEEFEKPCCILATTFIKKYGGSSPLYGPRAWLCARNFTCSHNLGSLGPYNELDPVWAAAVGKELGCERETDNSYDCYAVEWGTSSVICHESCRNYARCS